MDEYIKLLDDLVEHYDGFELFLKDPCDENAWDFMEIFDAVDHRSLRVEKGASKLVIIDDNLDYVIKIPIVEKYDYCEKEVFIYEQAKRFDLAQFFAESMKLGEYSGQPIYLMEKMDVNNFEIERKFYEGYQLYCEQHYIDYDEKEARYYYTDGCIDDYIVVEGLFAECSWETMDKLILFLTDFGVNDLFENNFGLDKDGEVMIIDYSGYGINYRAAAD